MKIKRDSLDILFSKIVRTRDGWECQRCRGRYDPPTKALHCAHNHSRRHESVRWEEDNACSLDFGCHQLLDSHPIEKIEFFDKRLGKERNRELYLRSKVPTKVDRDLVLIRLRARAKELGI